MQLEANTVLNWIRETTGIYGLGFRRESVAGLILPFAIVIGIGVLAVIAFYVL